jgi:transposase
MKKMDYVGIDVSKEKLDLRVHNVKQQAVVVNKLAGLKKMHRWILKQVEPGTKLLFCFEHTGLYAVPLQLYLEEMDLDYVQVSGLHVKRSLGIQRGKNDQVDAQKLAEYAYMHRDTLRPFKLESVQLLRLKYVLSLRSRLVRQRGGYVASAKEYKTFLALGNADALLQSQRAMIKAYDKQIILLEEEIKQLIASDEKIQEQYSLATSVKGIGMITAAYMIALTNGFTTFRTWRQFACYAGSAPFEHQSGKSIRGKTRISHYANKQMKAILTNAAISAIQFSPELKQYYQRRIKEGKQKKVVVNIIRNKLISRVFAVINRGKPYIELVKYAA